MLFGNKWRIYFVFSVYGAYILTMIDSSESPEPHEPSSQPLNWKYIDKHGQNSCGIYWVGPIQLATCCSTAFPLPCTRSDGSVVFKFAPYTLLSSSTTNTVKRIEASPRELRWKASRKVIERVLKSLILCAKAWILWWFVASWEWNTSEPRRWTPRTVYNFQASTCLQQIKTEDFYVWLGCWCGCHTTDTTYSSPVSLLFLAGRSSGFQKPTHLHTCLHS